MSTARLTDQEELNTLYHQYVAAFSVVHPRIQQPAEFNDMRIIRAADNRTGVFYSPDATLPNNKALRIKNSPIALNLSQRMLDAVSFYLAQETPDADVPENLKISLGVNHIGSHWTGVEVYIPGFRAIYTALREQFEAIYSQGFEKPRENEVSRFNEAKTFISGALFAKAGLPLGVNEAEQSLAIIQHFSQGNRFIVKHFDSMNFASYHDAVAQGLSLINDHIQFESIRCSQQTGMTCGDHTTINLFMSGVYDTLPVINRGGITSAGLRQITDSVGNPRENIERIAQVLKSVAHLQPASVEDSPTTDRATKLLENIRLQTTQVIGALQDESNVEATNIIFSALCSVNPKLYEGTVATPKAMTAKQIQYMKELVLLFNGTHQLYRGVDKENIIPYSGAAEAIALDSAFELRRLHPLLDGVVDGNPALQAPKEKLQLLFVEVMGEQYQRSPLWAGLNGHLLAHLSAGNELTANDIRRLQALHDFKRKKVAEIEELYDPDQRVDYQERLNNFYNNSVKILLSKVTLSDKYQALHKEAQTQFAHTHTGLRLLADALLLIGCFALVGLAVGIYRVATGHTFFLSQNTAEKQLEDMVIKPSKLLGG